jgi:hypothetical protein
MAAVMRSIGTLLVVFVIATFATWFAYSRITQARRNNAYRAAIATYQRDLPLGMARADVKKYLETRKVDYLYRFRGNDVVTHEIKIGEDPGNIVCEPWNVYIALDFSSADTLREVHIRRIGTCL